MRQTGLFSSCLASRQEVGHPYYYDYGDLMVSRDTLHLSLLFCSSANADLLLVARGHGSQSDVLQSP